MAKVMYTMNIWLFRSQFQLAKEEQGLNDVCIFVARLYLKAWFLAQHTALAPAHDLQFMKDRIQSYSATYQ